MRSHSGSDPLTRGKLLRSYTLPMRSQVRIDWDLREISVDLLASDDCGLSPQPCAEIHHRDRDRPTPHLGDASRRLISAMHLGDASRRCTSAMHLGD